MKLSNLIDQYLRSLISRNVSPLTYRDYSHYLGKFLEFTQDKDISKIDIKTIVKYKKFLADYVDENTGLTLKRITQNYFLIALRSLFDYAHQNELFELNRSDVSLIKTKKQDRDPLDKKEIESLLNLPDIHTKPGLRDRAILETLFSTGILVSELSFMNRDQVDLVKKEISVEGRAGKMREIFLFDRCAYWLEKYLNSREDQFRPLFIRYQGNTDQYEFGERMRLTPRSIQRIVEKYAKLAELSGRITPQSFRHFLGLSLVEQGVSTRDVQEIMGYESGFSTQQYVKGLSKQDVDYAER